MSDGGKVIQLSERLCPWAKYRGRVRLQVTAHNPDGRDVVLAEDTSGKTWAVAFVHRAALDEIRLKWEGRTIDEIPTDEDIGAWLAYCILDKGGDDGTLRES